MEIGFTWWLMIIIAVILGWIIGIGIGRIMRWKDMRDIRSDAIKRSQSVILGNVYEKVLPFLPDFPYAPKDMIFIGKGFDYLVLDGLSAGALRDIIFLEIKSGKSTLNANEKMIRSSVESKKIRFEEYRF